MKALSVRDPHVSLIALRLKRIETRGSGFHTQHLGLIAIHASKAFERDEQLAFWEEPFKSAITPFVKDGKLGPKFTDLPRGAVVAVAELYAADRILRIGPSGGPVYCDERRGYHPHGSRDVVLIGSEPLTDELELAFGLYCTGRRALGLENVRRIRPVRARGALGLWNWTPPEPIDRLCMEEGDAL